MKSLPTSWISPTAFDAFKMIARGLGAAINLKARIGGAEEAAIRRRGTGEKAVSLVPRHFAALRAESVIVGYTL